MFAAKQLRTGLLAASVVLLAANSSALAQQTLQTPDGRQTVAPSDMPQQPTMNEDLANPSKINTRTIEPPVGDLPGVPGIESPGRKETTGPGMIMNGDIQNQRMKEAPADQRGNVETPRTGGLVLPEGIPTSVRIGPVYDVPMWQRGVLAFWLTIQFVVLLVVAIAMQLVKRRNEDEFQSGHIINPESTQASMAKPTHLPHTP